MRALGIIVAIALLVAGVYAYQALRSDALEAAYRNRLQALSQDYTRLSERYASVVKRTAVTELVARESRLNVVISTVDGELKSIDTPFNPHSEIHVDYVVRDGRLWIRRVHDDSTPAKDALVIDPELAGIDWGREEADYGLAIYRPLTEGRWIISVTANGALGLVKKAAGDEPSKLEHAPEVKQFDQLDREARAEAQRNMSEIGVADLAVGFWQTLTN